MSEFVREESAVFFTALEDPPPVLLNPDETTLVKDNTPSFAMSRLYLEATAWRTPFPQSERGLALADSPRRASPYQQRLGRASAETSGRASSWPIGVGLGKTLEIGLVLAELIEAAATASWSSPRSRCSSSSSLSCGRGSRSR